MNCKREHFSGKALYLAFCLGVFSGCHKQSASTQPVNAAQVPEVIQDAFQSASSELQSSVTAVEEAARKQDPTAVTPLLELMHRPDLSPEQRSAAARCLPPLLNAARVAADQGDQRAAQALNAYNASK